MLVLFSKPHCKMDTSKNRHVRHAIVGILALLLRKLECNSLVKVMRAVPLG